MTTSGGTLTVHRGGCHCGAVRFEVVTPAAFTAYECNCSICQMVGYQHLIVSVAEFTLLQGESSLTTYTFNTGVARHHFCSTCGVKSFYVPRSHPDGISVNVRALAPDPMRQVTLVPFDGRHWEQHIDELP